MVHMIFYKERNTFNFAGKFMILTKSHPIYTCAALIKVPRYLVTYLVIASQVKVYFEFYFYLVR